MLSGQRVVRLFVHILAATVAVAMAIAAGDAQAQPRPGEVYREYSQHMAGNDWRVTDPKATPDRAKRHLPNPELHLTIDDLSHAVRAEAIIDRWGGHARTAEKRIRFNGNSWITVPELSTTPAGHAPEKFLFQDNPIVEIPLSHLRQGDNTFEGTCGTILNFNWGQWGLYSVIVRVYYDPKQKPHVTGRISSPADGQSIAENPPLAAEMEGEGRAARVDFLALYEGLDENGDGVYRQWHECYHQPERGKPAEIAGHVGTVQKAPYQVKWDTRWVPDQPAGGIELVARIRDESGVWYVTEPVKRLSLDRPETYVRMYRAEDVPERFGVRVDQKKSCTFCIPESDDLDMAVEACLSLRTWHGDDKIHSPLRLNDWSCPIGGKNHHYAHSLHAVPVDVLKHGVNQVEFHSATEDHSLEVLWPGPALVVRYRKP